MLKECLEPPSLGPLVIGAIAFCLALFQSWFFLRQRRQAWIGWGGLVCLGAALYGLTIFINYNALLPATLILNERFQYSSTLLIVQAIVSMVYSFLGLKAPKTRLALLAANLAWLALLWSGDLVVSRHIIARHLAWLKYPYLEPDLGPLGTPFMAYMALAVSHLYLMVWLHRRRRIPGLGYMLVGFTIWGAMALHDIRATLGHPARLFVMEYGFLGFCFTIAGLTTMSYLKLERDLRQAQKLEALGMMAAGISHDFNNLLQVITANAEVMCMTPGRPAADLGHLGHIARAAAQGNKMVRNLLSLKRRMDISPRPLDLNAQVRKVAELLRQSLPPSITLKLKLGQDLPPALADPEQLEQVILNLGSNARDAMPMGGTLTLLTARRTVEPHQASHGPLPSGGYLLLSVRDTGMGMDEATRARIFEPFFSTKPSGVGSGLGLAVAQRVLEAHGGAIECQSIPGRGTSFQLFLPAAARQAGPAPEAAPEAGPSLGRGCSVLVVDDDPAIRQGLGEALRLAGYEVLLAADCGEATMLLGQEARTPQAAVVDLHLPGVEGGTCLQRLKALAPGLKTVLCSGDSRALASGGEQAVLADEVLYKPFGMAQMLVVLERLLEC